MNYNQAILAMARDGLAALADSALARKQPTAAQESHFICSWMADALKKHTYPKSLARDLTIWVRDGRSLGAGAQLKSLLERIVAQYGAVEHQGTMLGSALNAWLDALRASEVLVITDTPVDSKLKLDNDGLPSVIISAPEYQQHIHSGELVKAITLYIRADEAMLAETALAQGLLLSCGDKKASLIKHHKAYRIYPANNQPGLALLIS
ncbi:DUF2913 family protein [Shewanella sp. GXUN23E]|uniref:DUF2913 family protein n=1 Tax=Shewanella sp. GXUN23E TaxID=3422498 RepID=UPI003D7E9601